MLSVERIMETIDTPPAFRHEEYLEKYDPRQPMVFGFSIPDVYRYAVSANKRLDELTEEEMSQFSTSR